MLTWLGHDTFKITAKNKIIYIDPFQLTGKEEKADIILLSHIHHDHTSPLDIKKIQKNDTIFVTSVDSFESHNVHVLKPGESTEIDGISIQATPAYNIDKVFHPKENNWIGFIITIEGKRIYHAGDTDAVPELQAIKADICLLPVSGVYVMSAQEAVNLAMKIKPQVAIPMHYGSIVGSEGDAEEFKERLKGKVDVVIMKKDVPLKL